MKSLSKSLISMFIGSCLFAGLASADTKFTPGIGNIARDILRDPSFSRTRILTPDLLKILMLYNPNDYKTEINADDFASTSEGLQDGAQIITRRIEQGKYVGFNMDLGPDRFSPGSNGKGVMTVQAYMKGIKVGCADVVNKLTKLEMTFFSRVECYQKVGSSYRSIGFAGLDLPQCTEVAEINTLGKPIKVRLCKVLNHKVYLESSESKTTSDNNLQYKVKIHNVVAETRMGASEEAAKTASILKTTLSQYKDKSGDVTSGLRLSFKCNSKLLLDFPVFSLDHAPELTYKSLFDQCGTSKIRISVNRAVVYDEGKLVLQFDPI